MLPGCTYIGIRDGLIVVNGSRGVERHIIGYQLRYCQVAPAENMSKPTQLITSNSGNNVLVKARYTKEIPNISQQLRMVISCAKCI